MYGLITILDIVTNSKKTKKFKENITELKVSPLLCANLWERFEGFRSYGKDTLLLTLISYNVGVGHLLGYGKQGKSQLLRKIEQGDRNFYKEYISFCHYKGKVLRGLLRRRKAEISLFCIP